MRELLRNCVEHSKSQFFWYAGQYWEQQHAVEVAVLDEGVGIMETILSNPENGDVSSEASAIRAALLPGVSRVPLRKRGGDDANSGFGLYICRRLCTRDAGSFTVVSNTDGITAHESGESSIEGNITGTLVQMRLDTSKLDDDDDFAERLAEEGEAAAQKRTGQQIKASASSRSSSV
jgi:hypothetical protein